MKTKKNKISFIVFGLFIVAGVLGFEKNIKAQTRIFFEDFEDTSWSEHFAERSYGTYYQEYWDLFKVHTRRSSTDPYDGTFCLTTDVFNDSPAGRTIGVSDVNYGNTSHFSLSNTITGTKAYFRWRLKFESGINWSGSAEHKTIYINYRDQGDFVLTLKKNGQDNFHLSGRSQSPYELRENKWLTYSGGNLDDDKWHTYEVFIDWSGVGSTGTLWIKIDGNELYSSDSFYFRDCDESGPDIRQVGWPSNKSGTPTGTCNIWVDNLEIWDGIPNATGIRENSKNTEEQIGIYPNPFSETATIEYALSEASDVTISLYNSQGQKVKTIVNNFNNAGNHKAAINANDLPAGIYYFKIDACGSIQTKKSVLIR